MFKLLYKTNPVSFFVFAALLFGVYFTCVRPPMQSPDEFNHFCRAYRISEGHFFSQKTERRLGGQVPVSFDQFRFLYIPSTYLPDYKVGSKEMMEGFNIKLSAMDTNFIDFPNTSYYSLVSYLPQSLAIFVIKQFDPSVGMLYHGSRIFSYLMWMLAMVFVIRTLPIYKWLFTLLILTPGDIFINSSISADVMTNILCLLLIAFILKRTFDDKRFTLRDFSWVLVLGILLALTKIVYVSLLLLLLIIPAEKFITGRKKLLYCGIIFLVSCVIAQLWSMQIMNYYTPFDQYHEIMREFATLHDKANYYKQKEHLKQHPFHFFELIFNSLFKDDFYIYSYIARFGAFLDSPIPGWLSLLYYAVIIFVVLTEFTENMLSKFQKLILFISAFGTYVLLILTQHLTWNDIGNNILTSFQGRYLVPVFPLIFLLFNNSWQRIKFNPAPVVMVMVLFSNIYCCEMLRTKYLNTSDTKVTELYYNLEGRDEPKVLKFNGEIHSLTGRTSSQHTGAENIL